MPRRSLTTLADRLARRESGDGWRGAAYRAYLAGVRTVERAGFHVVRASYDSPIPRRADLAPDVFERESPMRGIAWDVGAQLAWVDAELAGFLAEWSPARGRRAVGDFTLDNGTYESVDAELLYAIVRALRPARVVELGSGYSSLVIAIALERNGGGEHVLHDPYPSPQVSGMRVDPVRAQDVPEEELGALRAGDILFVDTSHTVKMGGDVNRIVLDLLPLLAPGVAVHFHDIFLPRDYGEGHLARAHYWTEQYLLQAFLQHNTEWEVLCGAQALALHAPQRLAELVPSFVPGVTSPGAFWIRRGAGGPG